MTIRDLSLPQDEYCAGCFFFETGGCNVILGDDEDVCFDRLELTPEMMAEDELAEDDPGLLLTNDGRN